MPARQVVEIVEPARAAKRDEIPSSAQRLAEHARAHGWVARVTLARTVYDDESTRTSIAVRMASARGRLVGLWVDGKFKVGLSASRRYTLGELRAEIEKRAA